LEWLVQEHVQQTGQESQSVAPLVAWQVVRQEPWLGTESELLQELALVQEQSVAPQELALDLE